jgi:hypothetical protein
MIDWVISRATERVTAWRGSLGLRIVFRVEASGHLVGPPVFKTGGRRAASSAGSIPVRLRYQAQRGLVDRALVSAPAHDGRKTDALGHDLGQLATTLDPFRSVSSATVFSAASW